MGIVQNITVTEAESGQKLLQFLRRRLMPESGDIPDSLLHRIIRSGEVRVNGARAKPFQRVEQGQIVRIPPIQRVENRREKNISTKQEKHRGSSSLQKKSDAYSTHAAVEGEKIKNQKGEIAKQPGALQILAETADLLVLLKPAGLPVHPGTGHKDSLTTRLAQTYAGKPFMPTPAHRLDKETSGIVLAAKTYTCLARLHELFAQKNRAPRAPGTLCKEYLAWVHGTWNPLQKPVFLEDRLKKNQSGPYERMERAKDGVRAEAVAQALEIHKNKTLLLITLLTGRTHQIRVQLSLRGYPVIGDNKYGSSQHGTPMLLHAWRITLPDGEQYSAEPVWNGEFDVSHALKSLEP